MGATNGGVLMAWSRDQRRSAVVVAFLAVVGIGVAVGLAVTAGPQQQRAQGAAVPHYPGKGADTRTLVVVGAGTQEVSPQSGPMYSSYLDGTMPSRPMMATVLSDANCAPDAEGVSHCLNRLRLDDGDELTVRHNHKMIEVPCLSPGERVFVEPA
jgi:hypothetical protein